MQSGHPEPDDLPHELGERKPRPDEVKAEPEVWHKLKDHPGIEIRDGKLRTDLPTLPVIPKGAYS